MSKKFKKLICSVLTLCMIFTLVQGLSITAHAEETSVEIVSFVRGKVDDLRSSELLEARVSGYDGNLSDLTFTWSNQLGTYLYAYNSSNMYNIKDTAGEVEITGTTTKTVWGDSFWPTTELVAGETVDLKGYAWAAVYGANLSADKLKGYITVTVTDKNGNVIGTDTYNGPFASPSLLDDLNATNYGLFEGETIPIKDMLGRSAIVHIDCSECTVSNAQVSGNNITLNGDSVTGKSAGVSEISVTVQKKNCKFHQYSGSQTVKHNVYVFKKPTTSTTTTTMTLTNLDANCDYFIGTTLGKKSADGKTVEFTGLTPDTAYEVTIRGKYTDDGKEQYVYAYVTDTTKPVYKATVYCYTDDVLADFFEHFKVENNLYLKESSNDEYISLTRVENATYTAEVEDGIYYVYYKDGSKYIRIGDYQITIDSENNTLNIYTYSVRYNLNGGTTDVENGLGGVFYEGTAVYATSEVPKKEGSIFVGWEYDNNTYKSEQLVTEKISNPIMLTALWEEAVDVKVNITINHVPETGGHDVAPEKSNVDFRLVDITSNAPASEKVSLRSDSHDGYAYSSDDSKTTYTAESASFAGSNDANYTISCIKSGYEVISVEKTTGADGSIVLNALLEYDPKNFDLEFDVAMQEDVPEEFYPAGVEVKVTYWTGSGWKYITQHQKGSSVYVELDENGKGSASYPVWKTESGTGEEYYYSIEVVSYILKDGSVVTNAANAFRSSVYIEGDGALLDGTENEGAYFASEAQHGVPTAEITIKSYALIFDANEGKINGSDTLTIGKQIIIPDLLTYVPTRDGGYTFTGWYTDTACTTKAQSGTRLSADTTLYAGWEAPLSLSGVIKVEGFYFQNDNKVDVKPVDRAKNIVVTLQVKHGERYNDIMSVKSVLEYDSEGIATIYYQFTEIPDTLSSGTEYRMRTVLINYDTLYNNDNDDEFTSGEYTANFTSKTAKVDALLKFHADEYIQNYEIDATLIGEGFRPKDGITQVLFQTDGTTPPNDVISQHTVSPYGEVFAFGSDGIATGSLSLWKGISSGAMSTYQLKVTKIDGAEYTDQSTYTVRYGVTTNYSVSGGSAETLKAKLIPKEYVVKFDLNAGSDVVGGMDEYLSTDGESYFTMHKWSHNTPIAAMPTRDGYVFVGWEADEGVFIDGKYVDASVAEEVTLTAKWAEFKWTTDTDSGYFDTADSKKSVVRFLFDVATTSELKSKIIKTGIKFIKSNNIGEKVEDSEVVGDTLTNDSRATTFYGDITNIPETNSGVKYFAIGFVVFDGGVERWSMPVECGPDFNDLILYE